MKYIPLLFLCSCAVPLSVAKPDARADQQDYPTACKNPTYIATTAKKANAGESITLASLLTEAQTKYGIDATIHNVHFDIKGGKRISAIYDVIKCNETQ